MWDGVARALGGSVLVCRFDPSAIDTDVTATRRSDALSVALDAAGLQPTLLVGHSLADLAALGWDVDALQADAVG